ncbi:hypothetical protein GBAR_LOCUS26039, partial [Geodia barretti]
FFYPFPDTYGRLHTAEHCLVVSKNERRSLPFLVCTLSLCVRIAFSYASYFSFCRALMDTISPTSSVCRSRVWWCERQKCREYPYSSSSDAPTARVY